MAIIKPFKGLRFDTQKAGDIEQLTCPPYDIISEEQRNDYLKTNPHNVIRLELPKGERAYDEAGETLNEWLESGILRTDDEECIYIYEEEFSVRDEIKRFKGFICRVKVEEFSKGVVLPHEETLSKAKTDRFNLMKATFCNFSQIYSLYMDEAQTTRPLIDKLSEGAPTVEMTDPENVTHRLWAISDKDAIAKIQQDFSDRKLYIADGHHRYETALNFRNWCRKEGIAVEGDDADYNMMMLVDMQHEGLVVFPTHRLVRDLENFDPDKLIAGCSDYFDISEHTGIEKIESTLTDLYNQDKKAFVFYKGGENWTLLIFKDLAVMNDFLPEKSNALQCLDVSILHSVVLEKVFGIDAENMAQQINLTYTKYFDEAISAVNEGKFQCSFILNPTRVSEIRDVASVGEKMPQKSTYFYPKLLTGLVMNKIEKNN